MWFLRLKNFTNYLQVLFRLGKVSEVNSVPVHKKNDKQLVKNYRPISLLPIWGKMFERFLYNSLFDFLNQNDLIFPAQSGFKPDDYCINQLLSITHEIHQSVDEGYMKDEVYFLIYRKRLISMARRSCF